MSLKLKMTLWYTLLMLVIVVAALAIMLYASDAVAETTAQNTLESVVERDLQEVFYEHGRLLTVGFRGYDNGVYLAVYDMDGNYMDGWDYLQGDVEIPAFAENSFTTLQMDGSTFYCLDRFVIDDDAVRLASAEMASGEMSDASGEITVDGVWVRGILPAESMENTVSSVVKVAAIALPFLVLLAALGGWLVAKYSLQPVRKITDLATDISGGGDLSRRIDIGSGRDEIHTLADTFNNMFARLETSFRAERQFTSDASHELRTPTAVILAECSTAGKMLDGGVSAQELRPSIEVIDRQTRKMSNLISRLLSFTRLTQGTQKMKRENTDLSALTEAVCQEQASICGRGIQITADIQPEVTALADESMFMGLVQNLVSNACKYGRENGHVWVTLRRDGTRAVLSVRDDGIGMSEEQLPLIWNRFYQADPSRTNVDGSLGLGLSMAQEIAKLHEGEITVTSEPDNGSEFIFSMPAAEKNP